MANKGNNNNPFLFGNINNNNQNNKDLPIKNNIEEEKNKTTNIESNRNKNHKSWDKSNKIIEDNESKQIKIK